MKNFTRLAELASMGTAAHYLYPYPVVSNLYIRDNHVCRKIRIIEIFDDTLFNLSKDINPLYFSELFQRNAPCSACLFNRFYNFQYRFLCFSYYKGIYKICQRLRIENARPSGYYNRVIAPSFAAMQRYASQI